MFLVLHSQLLEFHPHNLPKNWQYNKSTKIKNDYCLNQKQNIDNSIKSLFIFDVRIKVRKNLFERDKGLFVQTYGSSENQIIYPTFYPEETTALTTYLKNTL